MIQITSDISDVACIIMLLLVLQTVGPSDRSDYIVDYYGAGLFRINQDNFTYVRPPKYT